jgi:DNA transformation protein
MEVCHMSTLTQLPNIGKELERQLNDIGIDTEEKLRDVGSLEAWLRIKAKDPSACYMRLCALEGALHGIRWHDLSLENKASLKSFYTQHK